VVGSGGLTAAVDAYGDTVDLRAPGPAGRGLIDNPAARQAAGTVSPDTGIVTRVAVAGGEPKPLWRADSVHQSYLPGTNVVRTEARFGPVRVEITTAVSGTALERCVTTSGSGDQPVAVETGFNLSQGARIGCRGAASRRAIQRSATADRSWLASARPLGSRAPGWARRMYARSLLVLRALTDRRTGAVAAGARDGWAYVWPRDAATAALALSAAGYRSEARRITRFLLGLDLGADARFHGDGTPVAGRAAQGDAWGWVAAAARVTGLPAPRGHPIWRNRSDYQEKSPGDYLANAIASGGIGAPGKLARRVEDPGSGWDTAAAWAVRPFPRPALYPAVRASLRRALSREGRFGLVPSADWPGADPWTAPTAWAAWSLAALGERRQALRLMADLRRAATPAGLLPERVDARTGTPTSTTPLAWSHAFAILALRELWPNRPSR
jgi:glycosyl hydrolase family 15